MAGSWLESRRLPMAAAGLAVLLALPSLGNGWVFDDLWHRTVLLERPRFRDVLGGPWEMFRFLRGDPERTGRLMDLGLLPWWTDPGARAEMLQALTVLTHRLDYALWPDSPAAMHAHSLLWLAAAVTASGRLYRRMMGPTRAAGIAALLFAVDDARGATVGWLANRNALVAATFGALAIVAHDRRRRGGSRRAGFLAPTLLLAALFTKEEGIGTCAYLAAYAMCIDPAGRLRGLLALAPQAAAVVAWAVLRWYWGYGVRDMGYYVDPMTETGPFLVAAVGRIPILLLGQWGPIPADLAAIRTGAGSARAGWIALAVLAPLAVAMAPLLRRDPLARFWAAGMVLAAVPVSAAIPADRLLTFVGLGASGLLARFWVAVLGGARWGRLAMSMAWLLAAFHAVLAPIAMPIRAANPIGPRWVLERLQVRAPLPRSLEGRTVVIVNAPVPVAAGYLVLERELQGRPGPDHTRVLAPAIPSVTVRRLDERTLAIVPAGGYCRLPCERFFRSERRPMAAGDRVELSGMVATVAAMTADGRPAEATFRFDVPLESPSLVWLAFRGTGFEPFKPPAVGRSTRIDLDAAAVLRPPGVPPLRARPPGTGPGPTAPRRGRPGRSRRAGPGRSQPGRGRRGDPLPPPTPPAPMARNVRGQEGERLVLRARSLRCDRPKVLLAARCPPECLLPTTRGEDLGTDPHSWTR